MWTSSGVRLKGLQYSGLLKTVSSHKLAGRLQFFYPLWRTFYSQSGWMDGPSLLHTRWKERRKAEAIAAYTTIRGSIQVPALFVIWVLW